MAHQDWIPNPRYLNKIKQSTLRRWNAELVGTVFFKMILFNSCVKPHFAYYAYSKA